MEFKLLLLALVLTGTSVCMGVPWVPEPVELDWWHDRHRGFVENTLNNNGSIQVLFYGDSITDWWAIDGLDTFNEYYAPLGTANYGIAGDRTEHLLWRMKNGEVTENLNPKVCVVRIGTNNVLVNLDTGIALGITVNVLELRDKLPNTKILLLNVLPGLNNFLASRIATINGIISNLDNGNTIRYLDMTEHFHRGGEYVTEMYKDDLVHLSEAGYKKWAEVMDPLFREMLNSD